MKISSVLVLGFICIMLFTFVFIMFDENSVSSDTTPEIHDMISPTDSVNLHLNGTLTEQELILLELNDENYWIDDDGKKHYVLDAYDSPNIQE